MADSDHGEASNKDLPTSDDNFLFHLHQGSEPLGTYDVGAAKADLERAFSLRPQDDLPTREWLRVSPEVPVGWLGRLLPTTGGPEPYAVPAPSLILRGERSVLVQ